MKFRVSQYTPYLLISLAITMIIRYFFDPLQLPSETYTLWDIKNNTVVNMDMDAFQTMVMGNVMNKIIHLLCPILSEISDWLKYFYGIMDDRGGYYNRIRDYDGWLCYIYLFFRKISCILA